jgi:hypothetical protein
MNGVRAGLVGLAVLAVAAATGCSRESRPPTLDSPSKAPEGQPTAVIPTQPVGPLSLDITNQFLTLKPGQVQKWVESEDGENYRITITVTDQSYTTKAGYTGRVVTDVLRAANGAVEEDTTDWFAQDGAGNVWYLGEKTRAKQDDGTFTSEGSWEAGVDGAQAGIAFLADPQVGDGYRQEFYAGHAEDTAQVLDVDGLATAPVGSYQHCVLVSETTPVEPKVEELKQYCPGVGQVSAYDVAGGFAMEVRTR